MAAIAANRTELLQIADAVARDKSIDKSVVLHAMEEAMQRAAKARYGSENEIRVDIDPKTGETHVSRYLNVVEQVENDKVLSAEAHYALARALHLSERFEEAIAEGRSGQPRRLSRFGRSCHPGLPGRVPFLLVGSGGPCHSR